MTETPPPIAHESLRRLYLYWKDRRRGRAFPSRGDIDPVDLRFIIGNVMLFDVLYAPLRFRFRLMGSNLTQRVGYDLTGRLLDDIPDPERRAYAKAFYASVVEHRAPQSARRDRVFTSGRSTSEFVAMPLSSDGITIDMLLAGNVFVDIPG